MAQNTITNIKILKMDFQKKNGPFLPRVPFLNCTNDLLFQHFQERYVAVAGLKTNHVHAFLQGAHV
jgi:hypothetical protein